MRTRRRPDKSGRPGFHMLDPLFATATDRRAQRVIAHRRRVPTRKGQDQFHPDIGEGLSLPFRLALTSLK